MGEQLPYHYTCLVPSVLAGVQYAIFTFATTVETTGEDVEGTFTFTVININTAKLYWKPGEFMANIGSLHI